MSDTSEIYEQMRTSMQLLKARKSALITLRGMGVRIAILQQKTQRHKLPKLHTWDAQWISVLDTLDISKYNRHSKLALIVPTGYRIPAAAHFIATTSGILDYDRQELVIVRTAVTFPTPEPMHISLLEVALNRYCKPQPLNYFSGSAAMGNHAAVVMFTKSHAASAATQIVSRLKERSGQPADYEIVPFDSFFTPKN